MIRLPPGLRLYHCPFNVLPLGLPCPGVVTIHDLIWLQSPLEITGIDEPLPEGENLLWQGRPDTRALMRHVFRLRLWVGYFADRSQALAYAGAHPAALGASIAVRR